MRRRAAFIALVLSVVAVTSWWMWRGRSQPQDERLGLTLLVNHGPHAEVTPGTPLLFEVSITTSASSGTMTLGSRWRPWSRLIRLEASGRAGMPWAVSSVGRPRLLSLVPGENGRPEINWSTASAVARLEGGRQVYTVTEVASPEAMSRVGPGAYRVRAVLETPSWMMWGWRGRKVSQPVTIVVRDASQPGEKRDALEKARLARAADYYLGAERFTEAERNARQLLQIEARQAHAHVLLGDALVGLKRRDDALAAYRRALTLTPPSYEQPTAILERIRAAVDDMRYPEQK